MEATTKLAGKVRAGKLALTAECLPPRSADAGAVRKLAGVLPAALDAVVVADNHQEIRSSAVACAAILAGEKIEPILSIVTRDRNRIALQSDVLGAAALGVTNFLCLSGDHQTLGACPEAAAAFDVDSIQLTLAMKTMRDSGTDFRGEALGSSPAFFLGASAHPYLRPMDLNLIRLRKKIASGAEYLLTEAVFDLAGFEEWMKAVRDAGLEKRVAIIASVRPLASAEEAQQLQAKQFGTRIPDALIARLKQAGNPAKEGVAICAELAGKVKGIAGVRGIHILCGGREAVAAEVIQQAHLAQA